MEQILHHMNNTHFSPNPLSENNGKSREKNTTSPSSSPLKNELPEKERKAKVAMLREEFIDLTQDPLVAMVLNQLFYWSQRVNDFDLFLEEENTFHSKNKESAEYGWFYKSAHELAEETMLRVTKVTMRKYLHILIEKGWISERSNTRYKWDKTSQYRLNFNLLQRDLQKLGWALPGFPSEMFSSCSHDLSWAEEKEESRDITQRSADLEMHPSKESFSIFEGKTNDTSKERFSTFDDKANDTSKERFSTFEGKTNDTSKESFSTFDDKTNNTSKESFLTFESKANDTSKVEKVNFLTETTTETINKEHTQRTCVREDFDKNFFKEILGAWKTCTAQGGRVPSIHLTEERKQRLQSVLGTHFQNDPAQWQQFCERVGRAPFLMGQGSRKWRVSLDWILIEENLLKVLEGNFDDPDGYDPKRASQSNADRTKEISAILASIEDETWKKWCSQLDLSCESREAVSLWELKEIANARFLEVEDDRLVWVGSQDKQVLSRIENLRLKILPIIQRTFPHARTVRTRQSFESEAINFHPLPTKSIQQQGGIAYA